MHRRKRKKLDDEGSLLDMTSMIDVVFLLLIFFMTATKFRVPEGELQSHLPRNRGGSSGTPTIDKGMRITVYMDESGLTTICMADSLTLGQTTKTEFENQFNLDNPPDWGQLYEHILARKDTYTGLSKKGLPVIVDFHKDTRYKYVSDILNVIHKAKIQDVSFAAPEIPIDGG